MDSLMKMIGCCDTENNINAEIVITNLDVQYLKGQIVVDLTTKYWTNCTTIKRGDVIYLLNNKLKNLLQKKLWNKNEILEDNMILIKVDNDYGLSG